MDARTGTTLPSPAPMPGSSSPRLSIVIPFYGVEDYIEECLVSIARQTLTDFEAILVDDGSPDGSAAIAADFCAKDPRFRVVTQPNAGLGPARNTGAAEAVGEYLTFVDSDDLVPRPAYERMVDALDRSGSSFAAGNARRFNNTGGVRESWTHRGVFGRNVTATHLYDHPGLIGDRMAWNKVYRRSFFDEFGYEFPAIRYEDFPISLRAHLDALSVDLLSAPCYFWRERESGDSITQQLYRYDNLVDRVVSAEMCFDIVEDTLDEVRSRVHAYLAGVDLIALVQGFAEVDAAGEGDLLELGQRLTSRLDPAAIASLSPYDQIQYAALQAGDIDLLRELARFRIDGGLVGGVRAHRRFGRVGLLEAAYPGLGSGVVERSMYRLDADDLTLYTAVSDLRFDDDGDLHVVGTVEITHLPTEPGSQLRVRLVDREGATHSLPVRRFPARDGHGDRTHCGVDITVPGALLAGLDPAVFPVTLQVQLRVGTVTRTGPVEHLRGGSPTWPSGHWLDDERRVQPFKGKNGELGLSLVTEPWQATEIHVEDDDFVISGHGPSSAVRTSLTITRGRPGAQLTVPVTLRPRDDGHADFTLRLSAARAALGDPADDPFTLRTTRPLLMATELGPRTVLWEGEDRPLRIRCGDTQVHLTRSQGCWLNLVHAPIHPSADTVSVAGDEVRVEGAWWPPVDTDDGPGGEPRFVWRAFMPGTDIPIDVACVFTATPERFVASVRTDALRDERVAAPETQVGDWTLFALTGDEARAVIGEPRAGSMLPLGVATSDGEARVEHRRGSIHIEIR